jgi:hypothetical protein
VRLAALALFLCGCFDWSQLTPPSATTCTGPSAVGLFCDGFEDPTAFAKNWQMPPGMLGSAGIDGSRAYRGSHSLHVSTPAVPATTTVLAEIFESQMLATSPLPRYVRVYLFVPAAPSPVGLSLLQLIQDNPPYTGISVGMSPAGKFYVLDNVPDPNLNMNPNVDFPTNQWSCIELAYSASSPDAGAAGGIDLTVSVEGHPVPQLAQTNLPPPATPPVRVVIGAVGRNVAGDLSAFDLWADEVVIDDKPIGCAR